MDSDYPDGENYLTLFYSKNGAPPNCTFFQNKQYDKLYEMAMKEIGHCLKHINYHRLENIIIEEAPVVPLFYDEVTRFVHKNISEV
ncbi:MAG: hypothetical protein R2807_07475 [Chitinophagales bacterium]